MSLAARLAGKGSPNRGGSKAEVEETSVRPERESWVPVLQGIFPSLAERDEKTQRQVFSLALLLEHTG